MEFFEHLFPRYLVPKTFVVVDSDGRRNFMSSHIIDTRTVKNYVSLKEFIEANVSSGACKKFYFVNPVDQKLTNKTTPIELCQTTSIKKLRRVMSDPRIAVYIQLQ